MEFYSLAQNKQSLGRRGLQNLCFAFGQNSAHSFCQHGKRKIDRLRWKLRLRRQSLRQCRAEKKAVFCAKGNEKAASFFGKGIALIAQQGIGMLHRDETQPQLRSQQPFGRKSAPGGVNCAGNVAAQLLVKLEIGRLFLRRFNSVIHLVL